MEIIKSRYGTERIIHKVSPNRLRIQGESLFARSSDDGNGNVTMFDFEGGPSLTVGGYIEFQGINWKINKIIPLDSGYDELAECAIEVTPNY